LDRVVVEHLRFHLARGQAAADLDDAVGERRLAVVDVGDDGEIADLPHRVGHGRASVAADVAALRGKRGIIARPARASRPLPGSVPARWRAGIAVRGQPPRATGEASAYSSSPARGVTAKKRVWLPRRTSSITVWPGFAPASARSSAETLPTVVLPTRSTTSPGRKPASRAARPSTRAMPTPSPASRPASRRSSASSSCPTRPSGLAEAADDPEEPPG